MNNVETQLITELAELITIFKGDDNLPKYSVPENAEDAYFIKVRYDGVEELIRYEIETIGYCDFTEQVERLYHITLRDMSISLRIGGQFTQNPFDILESLDIRDDINSMGEIVIEAIEVMVTLLYARIDKTLK